jgi:hypothetical protein
MASNSAGASDWSTVWSFTTTAQAVPESGLVGFCKFEENGGNILIDHSGNGNDASIANTVGISWITGKEGFALNMNGSTNSIGTVPHNATLAFSDQLTVSAWIRPNAVARRTIVSKGSPDGFFLRTDTNGKIEFRFNHTTNGSQFRLFSNQDYPTDGNTWMHVAVTFDGNRTVIYINGVEDNAASYGSAVILPNTTDLQIGAWNGNNRWNGDLDELRLYGRALDASEIPGILGSEISAPAPPTLLSPADGTSGVTFLGTQLSWTPADFAQEYRLQLANESGFFDPIVDQSAISETLFQGPELLPETTYFWRVMASNSAGASDWSTVWSFTTTSQAAPESGLIGFWKFEENGGNTLIDHSGNGNDASVANTAGISWITGKEGLALNMNGSTNSFGTVVHNTTLAFSDQMSVSVWIRPNAMARRTIVSKGSPDGFFLRTETNGKIEFRFNHTTNGTQFRLFSNQNYPTDGNTWIHVAVTFDGNRTMMYINGVEDNSATYGSAVILPNTTDLQIGAWNGSNRWSGDIDELQLYGRALESSEINDLHTHIGNIARKSDVSIKGKISDDAQLSVEEPRIDAVLGFKIFPNPVEDKLHIQLNSREEIQVGIVVYDMMGRQYINRSAVPENGEIILDLAPVRMADGTYLLILDQGQGRIKQVKFIKK